MARRGRRPLFTPRVCDPNDRARFLALQTRFGDPKNQRTAARVISDFCDFCALNGLEFIQGLEAWIGAMDVDGVAPGTVHTYFNHIRKGAWGTLNALSRLRVKQLQRIVARHHALADARGATAISLDELKKLVEECRKRDDAEFIRVLGLLAFTGMRFRDLTWLTKPQVMVMENSLKVEVRLAKNRYKRGQRRILRIADVTSVIGCEIPQELIGVEHHIESDTKLFGTWTLQRVNDRLEELRTTCHIPYKVTTYSLRKFYIGQVAKYCKFVWATVIQYTLHCDEQVVAAHYDALVHA